MVDGQLLAAGDGLAIWDESAIQIASLDLDAEILLFDLPLSADAAACRIS